MKIHYCWFGKNPKSSLILSCIQSWKKFHPDAEIIEWNETNFDLSICRYVREAYTERKYAFVSDYCRFFVLYHYGGVYLDTDVEVIKSLTDLPDTFVGFETGGKYVASGLIRGAKKGDLISKEMLLSYEKDSFILPSGELNLKTVCQRETDILKSHGLIQNNRFQVIAGTSVFPTDYFCPYNNSTGELKITPCTYSVHHYVGSWLSQSQKEGILKTRRRKLETLEISKRFRFVPRIFVSSYVSLRHDGVLLTIRRIFQYLWC